MAMCEVLIGHLFYGHARRRKGETVEMTASHAGKAAKAGQVRILPAAAADTATGPGVVTGPGEAPVPGDPSSPEGFGGAGAPRKKGGR